ncbi:hypothetical protein PV325_010371 [Microctonus aethiopoides]|nr:hypothetical protein PV325_010371 [Microctonus aethiopoides]
MLIRFSENNLEEGHIEPINLPEGIYAGKSIVSNNNGRAYIFAINTREDDVTVKVPMVPLFSFETNDIIIHTRSIEEHNAEFIKLANHLREANLTYKPKNVSFSGTKPLVWVSNFNDPTSRVMKCRECVREFDFKIQYEAGRVNTNADALSRNPVINTESKELYMINVKWKSNDPTEENDGDKKAPPQDNLGNNNQPGPSNLKSTKQKRCRPRKNPYPTRKVVPQHGENETTPNAQRVVHPDPEKVSEQFIDPKRGERRPKKKRRYDKSSKIPGNTPDNPLARHININSPHRQSAPPVQGRERITVRRNEQVLMKLLNTLAPERTLLDTKLQRLKVQ